MAAYEDVACQPDIHRVEGWGGGGGGEEVEQRLDPFLLYVHKMR